MVAVLVNVCRPSPSPPELFCVAPRPPSLLAAMVTLRAMRLGLSYAAESGDIFSFTSGEALLKRLWASLFTGQSSSSEKASVAQAA